MIHSESLHKISKGHSQERHFFLFDHQIVYCKKVSALLMCSLINQVVSLQYLHTYTCMWTIFNATSLPYGEQCGRMDFFGAIFNLLYIYMYVWISLLYTCMYIYLHVHVHACNISTSQLSLCRHAICVYALWCAIRRMQLEVS